jgi:hypothetical protein
MGDAAFLPEISQSPSGPDSERIDSFTKDDTEKERFFVLLKVL